MGLALGQSTPPVKPTGLNEGGDSRGDDFWSREPFHFPQESLALEDALLGEQPARVGGCSL